MGKNLDAQLKGETVPYVKAVYRMAYAIVRRVDNPLLMSDFLFHLTRMGANWRADLRTLHGAYPSKAARTRPRPTSPPHKEARTGREPPDIIVQPFVPSPDHGPTHRPAKRALTARLTASTHPRRVCA